MRRRKVVEVVEVHSVRPSEGGWSSLAGRWKHEVTLCPGVRLYTVSTPTGTFSMSIVKPSTPSGAPPTPAVTPLAPLPALLNKEADGPNDASESELTDIEDDRAPSASGVQQQNESGSS